MAITRAQQAKQMLQNGGMLVKPGFGGTRQGYRGDAASIAAEKREEETGQKSSRPGPGPGETDRRDAGDNFDRESFQRARDIGDANRALKILEEDKKEEKVERFRNKQFKGLPFPGVTSILNPLFKKGMTVNRNFFLDKVLGAGRLDYMGQTLTPEQFANLSLSEQEDIYDNYMSGRFSGETDAYGNPLMRGNDGPDPIPFIPPVEDDTEGDTVTPVRNLGGLTARIGGGLFDFDKFAADGGRIGAMDGGIANLDREAFLLGGLAKGLKKAVRGVKKLVKSPIGKAALVGAGFGLAGMGPMANLFSSGKGLAFKQFLLGGKTLPPSMGFKSKGLLGLVKDNPMTSIFLTSALAGAMTPKEEDNNQELAKYLAQNQLEPSQSVRGMGSEFGFYGEQFVADGGRIGYQEGSKEPVAKKTMPLIDMDGKEKDYRETGGFVDMGRMEKADDVPARLSKNEFVFTADAVRNAGEGDIDKGAEVMYNMMKNLEAGGEVSEESQGLEGAREMFQTSQRLGEVI